VNLDDAERLWQKQQSAELAPAELRQLKEDIVKKYQGQQRRLRVLLGVGSVAWCLGAWILLEDYFTGARSWGVWPPLFVVSMWVPLWLVVWCRAYRAKRAARAYGQSLSFYAERALAALSVRVRFVQGVLFFVLPATALVWLLRFGQKYQLGTWELGEWGLRFGLSGLVLLVSVAGLYWLLYKKLYPQRCELEALLS
jgi:hypothetical protein